MQQVADRINAIPRPEHPRPQFVRNHWLTLNGLWEFERDPADTGLERGLLGRTLDSTIVVPFAPESTLSGVGDTDFHEAVWYRRRVEIPAAWFQQRVLLHFQAVDHDATVWVNGIEVGRHRGGFTPFSLDITDAIADARTFSLVVRARDPRNGPQARGKQATWYTNSHTFYTRTTGIWQSVWLESVASSHFGRPRITPDVDRSTFTVEPDLIDARRGMKVVAVLTDETGHVVSGALIPGRQMQAALRLELPADRVRLWSPDDPHLYGLQLELRDADDEIVDELTCYAGLRSIAIDGTRVLLNGAPFFQRLVLDQGYWPESLMTAPSDADLVADIRLALDAGFNGARVHEKIAEERFLYHADRLGYLVWGEFADWGATVHGPPSDKQQPTPTYLTQWVEAVNRDYSHPSIIGWCPLNETYQTLQDRITILDDVTAALFWTTKGMDPTRPVIDASGYAHRVARTDIWDCHDYEQDPSVFRANHDGLARGQAYTNRNEDGLTYSLPYAGQPFMVSEFGGIWWGDDVLDADGLDRVTSWGYGQRVATKAEFYERFEALVRVLDQNACMFGYCYTQLTDVFQEHNGLYRFDRSAKFDIARINAIQTQPAASSLIVPAARASGAVDVSLDLSSRLR